MESWKKMEKRSMDRLIGEKCKIVSMEPGSKRASITTGVIEDIDKKDDLIFVNSKEGIGCLRIKFIVAIKPKKTLEKNNDAMVGIGTLIVFIAMILVAAVAASIIIRTSESLEQRAQSVATEITKEVSAGICIDAISGYTNTNKTRLTHLLLTLRPRAGSLDIDLSTMIINVQYNNLSLLKFDDSLVSQANTDNKSIMQTPVSPGSNQTILDSASNTKFGIIVIRDPDDTITNTAGMNSGDKIYVVINLSAIIPEENGLPKRQSISGEVMPETGSSGLFDITAPATFTKRVISLWR
jgi:flagellin FlaB